MFYRLYSIAFHFGCNLLHAIKFLEEALHKPRHNFPMRRTIEAHQETVRKELIRRMERRP